MGTEAAIGAGVGVPLAACALASLFLWMHERRKRLSAERGAEVQIKALEARWAEYKAVPQQQPDEGVLLHQQGQRWPLAMEADGREVMTELAAEGSPVMARGYR